jgi:hypothetical protein
VFEHFNPHFIASVVLESLGDETRLDWTLLFDSAEVYAAVVKAHNAEEGQKQNISRPEDYLKTIGV